MFFRISKVSDGGPNENIRRCKIEIFDSQPQSPRKGPPKISGSVRSPDSVSINFATKAQMRCYQMQTCPMHLNYWSHLPASEPAQCPCSSITGWQTKLLLTLTLICYDLKLQGCYFFYTDGRVFTPVSEWVSQSVIGLLLQILPILPNLPIPPVLPILAVITVQAFQTVLLQPCSPSSPSSNS